VIHLKFGSSTAKRTNACPGWHKESEGIPRKESDAALFGSVVHEILEAWNLGNPTPVVALGQEVDEEHLAMAEEMLAAQDEVFRKLEVVDFEPEVTGRADVDVGGTLDLVGLTKDGRGVLLDYKTGRGVQVDAVGNDQILFAASTALIDSCMKVELEGCEKFIGVILQPSLDGTVQTKTWEFTRDIVDDWWEHHSKMIAMARTDDAPLAAGEHCRFCPAAAICPEKNGQAEAALRMDPMDLETLSDSLDLVPDLEQWIKEVRKTALEQLEAGADVPGYQLARKRATERWTDVEEALKALRRRLGGKKEFMEEKPITPAAARKKLVAAGTEKTVADELVSAHTAKTSSGYNVVRVEEGKANASPVAIANALKAIA